MLNSQNSNVSLRPCFQEVSLCLSAASFWMPDLINTSAWIEHAPFAFWLMSTMKPDTLVELGTHQGYSYFAFCQAVKQSGLSTRCYAIDTWKGDEHSSFYGEEVFQDVHVYNNQNYSSFSQLIRSTFDEAIEYFLDKSIDLLHIDGRHFYEDVKHDFETWLPKLSDRAIVLFHDTNVKERHFGVFRLWEELRHLYPHFEFIHEHGLGVLGVGKSIVPEIRVLFDAANNMEQITQIRFIYSRLGTGLSDRYHLVTQTDQKEKLEQVELNLRTVSEENKQKQQEITTLHEQLIQFKNQLSIMRSESKQKDMAIAYFNRVLTRIYSSPFWRLTLPLRKLGQFFLNKKNKYSINE